MKKTLLMASVSSLLASLALYPLWSSQAQGLPPGDGPNTVTGTALEPTPVPFQDSMLSRLRVPAGFRINVFAKDMANARWMAVRPSGDVYVSRRDQGDIVLLRDTNRDGVADQRRIVAQNIKLAHGLTLRENTLYIFADKMVYTARINADGSLQTPQIIIRDLPDVGQHSARTLAFGPDGMLYLNVGSTCNNCMEPNPENATIVRSMPDGSGRHVFARGLRHSIGFGWHPSSRQMWGFDHGSDWRGDDQPPEELNQIMQNKDYGWPYCYANKQIDQVAYFDPPNTTKANYCPTTEAPILTYTAHAAPIGMVFYTGTQFPAEYRNDAFVAFRGSWNRSQPSGYKVSRIRFDTTGKPTAIEDFVSGWLMEPPANLRQPGNTPSQAQQQEASRPAQFGRLAGLAVWNDGSLLVAEDQNGVIYRISYAQ